MSTRFAEGKKKETDSSFPSRVQLDFSLYKCKNCSVHFPVGGAHADSWSVLASMQSYG